MADQFETGIVQQVINVPLGPGVEIIDADDLIAEFKQPLAEVGAEEAAASGDQNVFILHSEIPR